jgi:hypothetical protein
VDRSLTTLATISPGSTSIQFAVGSSQRDVLHIQPRLLYFLQASLAEGLAAKEDAPAIPAFHPNLGLLKVKRLPVDRLAVFEQPDVEGVEPMKLSSHRVDPRAAELHL